MFSFAGTDLSYRKRKDLARDAQLREFARTAIPQNSPMAAAVDDLYLPAPNRDLWRRNIFGSGRAASIPARYASEQYRPQRFGSLLNYHYLAEHLPPLHRTSSYRDTHPKYDDSHVSSAASFTKAARALHDALDKGTRYIANLEHEFQQDTGYASTYANPRVIDYLWSAKMEWNGVPVREALENPDASPNPETQCYQKYASRLVDAIEGMRTVDIPRSGDWGELSAEDVTTTLRKLEVSMGAIVGNLEALRRDRTRLSALVRELKSATGLLCDIGELWMVKRNNGKEGRFAEGEVWPSGN